MRCIHLMTFYPCKGSNVRALEYLTHLTRVVGGRTYT
uniref:Uncharacterized protein n=1 Tax=Anguilla anguilla TaxID=7936 RepID=A0A0E9U1N7_ANGAN